MIPSTPASSACLVKLMEARVLFEPVPAMTGTLPLTASTTTLNKVIFSSVVNVGDSPVVPAITMPSVPLSIN
jgi:hypothetical protein